jgi:hypothetical protein
LYAESVHADNILNQATTTKAFIIQPLFEAINLSAWDVAD